MTKNEADVPAGSCVAKKPVLFFAEYFIQYRQKSEHKHGKIILQPAITYILAALGQREQLVSTALAFDQP